MSSSKPMLFLLLAVFLALFSHGTSQITRHQTRQSSGVIESGMFHVGRVILQVASGDANSSLILADKRTLRKDPIDDFKYYTGGWNISNEHYISSVAYTAAPFFAIAAIWFSVFGVSLLLICCCYCCCRRSQYGYSKIAYALSLIFLCLFTIAAIIGSVVLYTGQGKFHESTTDTLGYVVSQSNATVYNLKNVSSILSRAKGIQVDRVSLPSNITSGIDRVDKMISDALRSLEFETRKNEKDIKLVLDDVRPALIIIAAVMLLAALLGFLFSILGLQFLVYILVILGWILVTATLILCGIFLALHNIMGDTCVAMDEWVEFPMAHTALDDILPCVDNATAQETLSQSKDVTYQLTSMVDNIINNVANINRPPLPIPFPGFLRYNQSGPLVPTLCNPLYANRTDRICQSGELDFNNATTVWLNYVCQVNANNTCTTVGRLTPTMYKQMSAAVNVSDGLTEYSPFLAGLLDCSFVRETFIGIHRDHCPDLNRFSGWVYIGLALSSAAVMFSLVLWVLYAREKKHRKYTKHVLESTSSPGAAHPGADLCIELGGAVPVDDDELGGAVPVDDDGF